ncbi:MAG: LptA/OstA family protein [Brevinema sp.]
MKIHNYIMFLLLFFILGLFQYSQAVSVAVTSGKSFFKTVEELVILETANNRRPTLSQGPVAFVSDTMIYDEKTKIGYAYGNLRFADLLNRTFFSAQEGTFFTKENKIVLRKSPEILLEQDNNLSTKIDGNIITIYPDDSYIHVQGNITIDDGTTFITGKEVRIWSEEDRMIVSGNVQSLSENQKLASDRLNVQFNKGQLDFYIARGNVIAVNSEDQFTLEAGVLSYEQEKDFYKAVSDPLIYFQEQKTVSYANIIEYDRPTKIGNLLGNVVSIQEGSEQKAYSRWAVYNGSNNIINMYGNPRLQQETSEIFGTEIIVNIDSNNMSIIGGGRGFFDRN